MAVGLGLGLAIVCILLIKGGPVRGGDPVGPVTNTTAVPSPANKAKELLAQAELAAWRSLRFSAHFDPIF